MFYEIDFSDGTNLTTLRYKIYDTPIANIWKEVTKIILSQEDSSIYPHFWKHTIASSDEFLKIWNKMYENVQKWNAGETFIDPKQIVMPKDIPHENLNNVLNYLHEEFHKNEEMYAPDHPRRKGDYDILQVLNTDIHTLEHHARSGSAVKCGFFNHSPQCTSSENDRKPIPANQIKTWTSKIFHGSLHLGYNTIGKTLWHCVQDNDIELVKQKMTRTQNGISNETVLNFLPEGKMYDNTSNDKQKIIDWVRDNKLEEYVDLNDPKNFMVGMGPIIGELETLINIEEANALLKTSDPVKCRLI